MFRNKAIHLCTKKGLQAITYDSNYIENRCSVCVRSIKTKINCFGAFHIMNLMVIVNCQLDKIKSYVDGGFLN